MNRRGFTLVELMIVITVIAILAAIAVASFTRVQKQARDTKRKADVRALQTALQVYFTEKGAYPISASPTIITTPLNVLTTPTAYISTLPTAPGGTTGTNVSYMYISSDGTKYGLCNQMEVNYTNGGVVGATMWWANTANGTGAEVANAACTEL